MKKNLSYIKLFAPFIIVLLFVKTLTLGMLFFLPKVSIEKSSSKNSTLKFRSYNISKSFGLRELKHKIVQIKAPTYDLKDLMLQAIYKNSQGGVIIVVDVKSKKTVVLTISEEYKGYKLIKIYPKYVVFLKDGRKYTLKLYEDSNLKEDKVAEQVQQKEEKIVSVPRKDIKKYATNFKAIWKHIVIDEVKQNGKISGFKIKFIRKKSVFGKLGLKRGDIITKINSEPLISYAQAFRIYNNIQNYSYLTITVLRDGKEKDFDYEIR